MKRKLTKAEKRAKRERKKNTRIIFINGRHKRVPREPMIDGIPVDEFIARNADPVWLMEAGMFEYLDQHFNEQPGAGAHMIETNMPEVELPLVHLFTDGACIGNPGPGGWAFILKHPKTGRSKEGSGGEHNTTNNRMEIMAAIAGLEALKVPSQVQLFSDSQYVVNAITDWMAKWKSFGWKRSKRSTATIRNLDLWQKLDGLLQRHDVKGNWVRGHVGHIENERCDVLAVAAAAAIAKTPAQPRPAENTQTGKKTEGDLFGLR